MTNQISINSHVHVNSKRLKQPLIIFYRVTGNPKYEDAVSKVSRLVHGLPKTNGLVPIFINANNGQFRKEFLRILHISKKNCNLLVLNAIVVVITLKQLTALEQEQKSN